MPERQLGRLKGRHAPGLVPSAFVGKLADNNQVTIVMTDVEASTALWEWNGMAMNAAISMHDDLIRYSMRQYHGYEVTTEGDAFIIAFHAATDAIAWASHLQLRLLTLAWPRVLHTNPVLPAVFSATGGLMMNGLRVRVAMETGYPTSTTIDSLTGRMQWTGALLVLGLHVYMLRRHNCLPVAMFGSWPLVQTTCTLVVACM